MMGAESRSEDVPSATPTVVILGAGFGGLSAARALLKKGVRVVLVDRQNHHLFQPLLYQVATATLSPGDISVPIRSILTGLGGEIRVLCDEVAGIDRAARKVRVRSGLDLSYDYLIVATGSRYNYFGHDEWARHARSLKTNGDALAIRQQLLSAFEAAEWESDPGLRRRHMTLVVIGGGPTGVEMAGALAELTRSSLAGQFSHLNPATARIVLVEATGDILASFAPDLRQHAARRLADSGVELLLNAPVEEIGEHHVVAGGRRIEAGTIIWCAGVAATPAAEWLGVEPERGGRIKVDPDLTLPSDPDVFVVGDLAQLTGEDGKPLPALAPVAKQEGAHAAHVIAERITGRPEPGPFRYRDWGSMATIGRGAAVGEFGRVKVKGFIGWLAWGIVHIFYLIGFRNRLAVLISWTWAILRFEKSARIIIEPQPLPSRQLEREPGLARAADPAVNERSGGYTHGTRSPSP